MNKQLELTIGLNTQFPFPKGFTFTDKPSILKQRITSTAKIPNCFKLEPKENSKIDEMLVIQPRYLAETDDNVRHIIPYTIIVGRHDRRMLFYRRKGSEQRLNQKWSVGIGGHTNLNHLATVPYSNSETKIIDLQQTVYNCIKTECEEELGWHKNGSIKKFDVKDLFNNIHLAGEIVLDNTEVNSVHYGLLNVLVLPNINGLTVIDGADAILYEELNVDHKHHIVNLKETLEVEDWSSIIYDVNFQRKLYELMTR